MKTPITKLNDTTYKLTPKDEKKIYSLFVGRWQPFHKGHKALIETVLKEGKSVLIAIRNTDISESNPLTVLERKRVIKKALAEWKDKVKIISIPDIEEVCYGRKVGWGIREITLPKELEDISATKIRNDNLGNRQ